MTAPSIPDFQILGLLGTGAFGQVWLGRSLLGSLRAVKVLRFTGDGSQKLADQEIAGLTSYESISESHPALVTVFHIGSLPDGFYYVMELADDLAAPSAHSAEPLAAPADYHPRTLASEAQLRGRLPLSECLGIGIRLADALQHLHDHGMVHRDIKPSNVLYIKGQLKLGDIGLVTQASQATGSAGTSGYRAPEGSGTAAGDIFALGKLLYELATGNDARQWPVIPRALLTGVEGATLFALNNVLLRACAPIAGDRFGTPSEMGTALQQVQAGFGAAYRRALVRQKRLMQVGVVLGVAATVLLGANVFLRSQRNTERHRFTELLIANANRSAEQENLADALLWSTEALRRNRADAADESAIDRLRVGCFLRDTPRLAGVWTFRDGVRGVEFSPDGRLLAGGSFDGSILIASATNPLAPPLRWSVSNQVWHTRFSADGERLLTATTVAAGFASELRVWSTRDGRPAGAAFSHPETIREAVFSPDGKIIAIGDDAGGVLLVDPVSARVVDRFPGHKGSVRRIEFSPDGTLLLTASWDGTAALWNLGTCRLSVPLLKHEDYVRYATFSPDGRLVATCGDDRACRLWEVATGRALGPPLQHDDTVRHAAFSPDGLRIVTASADHEARVWDVGSGRLLTKPLVHRNTVRRAVFSPDGRWILTGSHDKTARIWDAATGEQVFSALKHDDEVSYSSFSPDGRWILTASGSSLIKLWELPHPWHEERIVSERLHQQVAEVSADSRLILTHSSPNGIRVYPNQPNGKEMAESIHSKPVNVARFNRQGSRVASGSDDGTVRMLNLEDLAAPVMVLRHSSKVRSLAFDPRGGFLVTAAGDRKLRLWDIRSGNLISESAGDAGPVSQVQYTPDGSKVITSSSETEASRLVSQSEAGLWVPGTWRRIRGFPHDGRIWHVECDPAGTRIVTTSGDHTARVWDLATGDPVTPLLHHENEVACARFSPDGRLLATGSWDHTARVWSVASGTEVCSPLLHNGSLRALDFSEDGRFLVTGSEDGTCRIWDPRTGQAVSQPLRHTGAIMAARFSQGGGSLYVATRRQPLIVWPLEPTLLPEDYLADYAKLSANYELDAAGNLLPLGGEAMAALWSARSQKPAALVKPQR